MSSARSLERVQFMSASTRTKFTGLLGWVSFRMGGLRVEGVALRRTRAGRLTLAFPERRDSRGRGHALVRPLDNAARAAIEAQVFEALGLDGRRAG